MSLSGIHVALVEPLGLLRLCGLTLAGFGGNSWILLVKHQEWA